MNKLPLLLLTGALGLTLALAGCGATTDSNPSDPSPSLTAASADSFNDADEMFVTMMIPHHQQAVEMADVVLAKDGVDERVTDLAVQIKDAQAPEIELMLGWLDAWGVEFDPTSTAGHAGMDQDAGDGMMSSEDMAVLEEATGEDAGAIFLEQMVVHHEGAVDMAEIALQDAKSPEVQALAQQVIDDQTAEIAVMEELLAQL
ncbi:DUF305 domain-containing protein [Demequina aurantiaca]|uniref:DUF305 domain-containing protein n=1 Tax=Demequina aurantiaca TaxID=676200 RepID=UPI003D333DDE